MIFKKEDIPFGMHDIRQSELEEPIPEISLAEKYLKRKFGCGLRVQGFPGINLISYLPLLGTMPEGEKLGGEQVLS